jgi:hypothetical protein
VFTFAPLQLPLEEEFTECVAFMRPTPPSGICSGTFHVKVGRRALDKWIGRAIAIFVRLETNNRTKSTMELQLQNKIALVTGSTAGIGESIAKTLAQEG